MESVLEEAKARAASCSTGGAGRGYVMAGSPEDFPYMHSLLDAEEDGNFDLPFHHALTRYEEDASPSSPNFAPKEFWPSTSAFRGVLYRAAKRQGRAAGGYLDRIPDLGVRLLTAIEMEAGLNGLPEFQGITVHQPRREQRADAAVCDLGSFDETAGGDICSPNIRCPKCKWQPRKAHLWSCDCGHRWNTFDTGGICPECHHQWTDTCCPRCQTWSPHSEWYTCE